MTQKNKNIFFLTFSPTQDLCGTWYLFAYLTNKNGEVLEFDSLVIHKKCTDNPGLSLRVSKSSDKVGSGLEFGITNPFRAIGIDSISVANIADKCTQDITSCNLTDMQVINFSSL